LARVLIADNEAGSSRLQRLLGSAHNLKVVTRFDDALASASKDSFDLIIIGVQFDESQMYELLSALKNNPQLKNTPVMGFSETHTMLSQANRDNCESGMHLLGACDYVDTQGMTDAEILERIGACLNNVKGVGRRVDTSEQTPREKRENQRARRAKS